MKNNLSLFLVLLLSALSNFSYCQTEAKYINIIKRNRPGEEYSYRDKNSDVYNRIYIKYLGHLTNKKHEYKVLTWKSVWGENKATTGIIYLYDNKNHYLGRYILGDAYQLPSSIISNKLIFTNDRNKGCDNKLKTRIDFSLGIPEVIFIKCEGKLGDVYSFESYTKEK